MLHNCRRLMASSIVATCLLLSWTANAFLSNQTFRRPNFRSVVSDVIRKIVDLRPLLLDHQQDATEPAAQDNEGSSNAPTPFVSPERTKGLFVLLSVPIAWGTFEPSVRFVYDIETPIPPFLFSLATYMLASGALSTAVILSSRRSQSFDDGLCSQTLQGGLELGLYLFVGNALQVLGLKTIPADRAAFLLQLTTVLVPLMEAFFARNFLAVSRRVWVACALALSGVGVMGLDGKEPAYSAFPSVLTQAISSISAGDFCTVGAAVVYTFHCIRLERFAKTVSPLNLAASKAMVETLLTGFCVAGFLLYSSLSSYSYQEGTFNSLAQFAMHSGQEIKTFTNELCTRLASGREIPGFSLAIAVVVWTGLVTEAYTIYAQSYGQRRVRPVTANLIYTIQPIFTALFAWLLLGETLGPAGVLGGAMIGSAVLLVTNVTED